MPADCVLSRWRRFMQFSMRGLVVVLVMAIVLGWFVRSAHVQRDAVATIVRAGGSAEYDWPCQMFIHNTRVTDDGSKGLKQSLPGLTLIQFSFVDRGADCLLVFPILGPERTWD